MSQSGMVKVFDNSGVIWRSWVSVAVLTGAVIWGAIELVRVYTGASDSTGYLFGFGFLAAAGYGGQRLFLDTRDTLVSLAVDFNSRETLAVLWRPWGLTHLTAPLDRLTGWDLFIAIKTRQQRTYLLRFRHPDYPDARLQIELPPTIKDVEGLRRLAPEAIAEFEENTGRRKAA
jgi:hypothetical protein